MVYQIHITFQAVAFYRTYECKYISQTTNYLRVGRISGFYRILGYLWQWNIWPKFIEIMVYQKDIFPAKLFKQLYFIVLMSANILFKLVGYPVFIPSVKISLQLHLISSSIVETKYPWSKYG